MRLIKSNIDNSTLISELMLKMDPKSEFTLIEEGFEPVVDCINIVFSDIENAKDLLIRCNYYKSISRFFGKKNDEHHLIKIKEVVYIEGVNNDTYIHTMEDEYSIKEKLYELEKRLSDHKFIRVSKSYIVSVNHIEKIKPTFNGKLVLKLSNGLSIEVSRHYIKKFREYLGY